MLSTVCVNALKGATLISTRYESVLAQGPKPCVNALKGATLISTMREITMKDLDEIVSMP